MMSVTHDHTIDRQTIRERVTELKIVREAPRLFEVDGDDG